jgi:hypothetical protein
MANGWHLLSALALFLLVGCTRVSQPALPVAPSAAVEEEVREVVFRHLFMHNHSGMQQSARIYCLALDPGPTDPGASLIARFQGEATPIKPVSACSLSAIDGVKELSTGNHGLIFRVGPITWINSTNAEVEGGYYEGGDSASSGKYSVVKEKGSWHVTQVKDAWIS